MTIPKYEYTRTIRQNLAGNNVNDLKKFTYLDDESSEDVLNNFLDKYKDLISCFEKTFFYKDSEGYPRISKNIQIKKDWARNFARETFYKPTPNGKTLGESTKEKSTLLVTSIKS